MGAYPRSQVVLGILFLGAIASSVMAVMKGPEVDHYSKGLTLMRQKKYNQALTSFIKASNRAKMDPTGFFGMGWALQNMGKGKESIAKYNYAIEQSQQVLFHSFHNLAVIYERQGKLKQALATAKKARRVNRKNGEALVKRIVTKLQKKQGPAARKPRNILLKKGLRY